MNTCIFNGRLATEPELMKTKSGKSVMRISLAIPKGKEQCTFATIIIWDKQAEYVAKYASKGMRAIVESSYDIRMNEKDGKAYYNHEFNCRSIELIFDKKESSDSKDSLKIEGDDLPF